jgi:putative membrane protein
MNRTMTTILAVCLACAGFAAPRVATAAPAPGDDVVNSADIAFATDAAVASATTLALDRRALEQASSPLVRRFADKMIADRSAALADIVAAARAGEIALPDDLISRVGADTSLSSGADFDVTYMKAQVAAHERTLELYASEARWGMDQRLRNHALSNMVAVAESLGEAKRLLRRVERDAAR